MRTLLPLMLVACTGSQTAPAPPSTPPADAARSQAEETSGGRPPQGPPPPVQVVLAELETWVGTQWELADGRRLSVELDGAKLGDETVNAALTGGGGKVADHPVRLVTPCALALWEGETWVEGIRAEPACSPAEAAVEPSAHVTWSFPGGDQYTVLPQGRVWRHGKGRLFRHPVGQWTQAEGGVGNARFGETEFVFHPVDGCHLAVELPKLQKLNRATRSFPPCAASTPYTDLAFTLWKTDNNDLIDLHAAGQGQLDVFSQRGREAITWSPTEAGFQAKIGARTLDVAVTGCAAVVSEAGQPPIKATRAWPKC